MMSIIGAMRKVEYRRRPLKMFLWKFSVFIFYYSIARLLYRKVYCYRQQNHQIHTIAAAFLVFEQAAEKFDVDV